MYKKAGAMARSMDDLVSYIGKAGVKGDAKKLANKAMFGDNGTGSFLLGLTGFEKRKALKKVNNAYQKIQRKAADVDMRMGAKAYDFLDGKKGLGGIKNSLVHEQEFLKKNTKGSPDEFIKIKTPGLTNPISKVKSSVTPFVGTMALGSMILPHQEGGDTDE